MIKRITRRRALLAAAGTVAGAVTAKAGLLGKFAGGGSSPSGPPPAPVITSPTTASGTVGSLFNYQITATHSPTSFGAANLPADNLSLNTSSGVISGTPTTATTINSTISATNAGGTGTGPLGITIASPPAPVITSPTTASGNVGSPFFYQITATNLPTSFGVTNLPADSLSLNTSTGVISGTPTSTTTINSTVSATNAGGTGTGPLAITISSATPPGSIAALAALMVTDVNARGNKTYVNAPTIPSAPTWYSIVAPWGGGGLQQFNFIDGSYLQYAIQDSLVSSSFPTTMMLVQDGAVAGGVPTNTFGWVFRPGDIPAGHAPEFQVSGVTWGYSHGLYSYWPDGSLKYATFSLMVPVSPPSFPAMVTISDGGAGTWPAASGRTLAEVYLQNLVVNGKTPSTAIPNNARSADLFGALANDSNNFYAVKDMDGAAGARWKIKTKMATSVGGTADPRLIVSHYIFAMNNAAGGLGGFRWFGNIRNPLRDDQAGGEGEWIAFQPPSTGSPSTGLNWSINPGGAGTVYTPVQFPFNTANYNNGAFFTGSISGNILTVTSIPSSFIMPSTTITASSSGGFEVDITAISPSPFAINFGTGATLGVSPVGLSGGPGSGLFGFSGQISSSEPDGHFGGRGTYNLDNASFAGSFTNQPIILTSKMPVSYGSVGLYNGSTLTGQAAILGQLTSTEPDGATGQRGTYALDSSVGTIGSGPISYYSTLTIQADVPLNWYSGGSSGNRMLARVTGGSLPPIVSGALPLNGYSSFPTSMMTGVSGGAYSCLFSYGNSTVDMDHNSGSNDMFSGPGYGVIEPLPAFPQHSRFQLATKDGKYWFFQGTGSIAADSTLRNQINQAYWQSTGCFPPLQMDLIGVIPNTGYRFDWNPYSCGVCRSWDVDTYGPPYEVGIINSTAAIDFYVQTFESEKENRIFGLYAGTTASDWTDMTSVFDQIPPAYGTGTPYTGLPPALEGISPGTEAPGISTPINNPTHEPDFGYWAFLRFGELQYFDYMVDWGQLITGYQQWQGLTPSPPYPYGAYGNIVAQGQDRGTGWGNRDLQKIAFICSYNPDPINFPMLLTFGYGGTQLAKYIIDHADDQCRFVMAEVTTPDIGLWGTDAAVAYLTAHPGAWQVQYNTKVDNLASFQPYQLLGYFYGGMMFGALRGNSDATRIISNMMIWLDEIANHSIQAGDYGGNGYLHFYRATALATSQIIGTVSAGQGHNGQALMDKTSTLSGGSGSGGGTFWDSGSITAWVSNVGGGRAFTMDGSPRYPWYGHDAGGTPPYPRDNDAIPCFVKEGFTIVNDGSQYPMELTLNDVYYIRDLTPIASITGPWSFNLATSKGGPAITIHTSNPSPHFMDTSDSYIPSNPDVLDAGSPDFLRQVGDTIFWLHAIATSSGPNGVNQFANFT